ncbi:unnamed protein product, partial [Brassica oleracea]
KDSLQAGLGWIFSSQIGQIGRGSEVQEFVSSPLMAETLACRSSLRHALSIDIENLRIFGVVADIKNLSALFESISFNFIPRSEN